MDLVSDPKVAGRCISGASKVQLDFKSINLNRHRKLTPCGSIGRALRVIANGHGGDSNPVGDSGNKTETSGISAACSSEEALASVDGSIDRIQSNFTKSSVVSLDAADARKRKAELALLGSKEWMHLEHMERRPNPISRDYLLPAADLDNRKAIELAKERFGIQDKENISPVDGYRRRQTRKQATDRSCGEKRGLQVSSKQHNAPGNDTKVGSVVLKLMTGDGKPTISEPSVHAYQPDSKVRDLPSKGFLQQVDLVGTMATSKTAEPITTVAYLSLPRTGSSIQHLENDVFITSESMIISPLPLPIMPSSCSDDRSQPLRPNGESEEKFPEVDMDLGSKPFTSSGSLEKPEMQLGEVLVEARQVNALPASVKELSSVMNFLKISDHHCHGDMLKPSLSEKAASSQICNVKQNSSNIQGQSLEEARSVLSMSGPLGELHQNQGFTGASIATSAPCLPERQIGVGRQQTRSPHSSSCDALHVSSLPSTVANACSITVRDTSAPLAPFTSMSQPFTGENVQPSSKLCPSPADDILKPSQLNYVSLVSAKAQSGPLQEEGRHSPLDVPMLKGGKLSEQGYGRSSEEAVLVSEGNVKSTVLSEVNNPPEKKAISGGDVNLQTKKHGETEHYVWVNGRRYQKLKKIGSGGSSEVYKVIDRDCTIYALKRIKLKGRDYGAAFGFYQEIEYLKNLCGQTYIVRLIDHEVTNQRIFHDKVEPSCIIKDNVYIYMVLEYGEIDLAHMLVDKWKDRSQGKKVLDETWLRFHWHQILEAVNTIHEERIVHSDLKPANFLLVKGVLKLIDFGIAKAIQSDTTHIERESQVGTVNYMSPEAFLMNEKDEHGHPIKCGRSSDIWSLGCILYQMVYGTTPFAHITSIWAKVQEVTNPNHTIHFPPLSNPYLLDIMKKCLAWRCEERLRIPELLNHPFLNPQYAKPVSYPCSKQEKEEILLQIQIDYQHDKEVSMLSAKLLERFRMLESATDE